MKYESNCVSISPNCYSVDCRVTNWGACDKKCGPGFQRRTVIVPAAYGGQPCGDLIKPCKVKDCPGK